MHSAIGSMNTYHSILETYSHRLEQNYPGETSKQIYRYYNLTYNHRHKILHTIADKTIVSFDMFARDFKMAPS